MDQDLRGTAPGGGAPGPPGAPKGGGIEPGGPRAIFVSQRHRDRDNKRELGETAMEKASVKGEDAPKPKDGGGGNAPTPPADG